MSDTWIAEELDHVATPSTQRPLDLAAIHRDGQHLRRRRHTRHLMAGGIAALAITGVTLGAAGTITGTHPAATLTAGRGASANTGPADTGEQAAYWYLHEQLVSHTDEHGTYTAQTHQTFISTWDARDGSSVVSGDITPSPGAMPRWVGGYEPDTWDGYWQLPTDPAGLKSWFDARVADAYANPGPEDYALWYWAQGLLTKPGTIATHQALVTLMSALTGVTTSSGTDSLGRPATILSYARDKGEQDVVYADPNTGLMLEGDYVLGAGNTLDDPPSTLSHLVYTAMGPVDSATSTSTPTP